MVGLEKDIGFIAVGGAGLRVASHVAKACSHKVSISLIDTDTRALAAEQTGVKFQVGVKRTGGHGCGGDVGVGRLSVEDELEAVREIMLGQRLVVVFAGLGGGAGSGGAATVLRAAREAGCFTVGIVTLPFTFEGQERYAKALAALTAIQDAADSVLCIPSDNLFEHIGDGDVASTFSKADAILGEGASAICNLFSRPGYIQLDLGDLRSLALHSEGVFSFGYGAGKGGDRVQEALRQLHQGPLLQAGALIDSAAGMVVGILGGEDLKLSEISEVMLSLQARVGDDCHLMMGTTIDAVAGDRLTLVVLCADTWAEQVSPLPSTPSSSQKTMKRGSRNRGKSPQLQTLLRLDMAGMDRFKGADATVIDGEDLDTPTYIRRGIRLEK